MIMPHVTSSRRLNLGLLVAGLIAALIANTSAYSHQLECPRDWIEFKPTVSCYRFIRYPLMNVNDARSRCAADGAFLLAVESLTEHMFIQDYLTKTDIEQRKWYTSGQEVGNRWIWTSINAVFSYEQGFLPQSPYDIGANVVYSYRFGVWGWTRDFGNEPRPFICEIPIIESYRVLSEKRTIDYGLPSTIELRFIPRGPKIIEQPLDLEFGKVDPTILGSTYVLMKNEIVVTLKCLADGYPIPEYEWYRGHIDTGSNADYEFYPVDLTNERYFQHGGSLVISQPNSQDSGSYYCKASNAFGTVNSNIMLLREIVLDRFEKRERPNIIAQGYREAVINCLYNNKNTEDINYIWFFNALTQKVQQSKERFISRNGNLYFSRVTSGDIGNYICAVKSSNPDLRYVSSQTSETTHLEVIGTQGSERDPRIWADFPQVFPNRKLPKIGSNATIECIAEGYPIPDYRWYRVIDNRRYPLQHKAILYNLNRALLIPNLQREDAGLYECYVQNYRNSHNRTVLLQIEIEPMFTVPIEDQVLDVGSNLHWYCEATGNIGSNIIYTWYVNGSLIKSTSGRVRADGQVLHMLSVQKYDSGMYQCAAFNLQNSITRYSTAELRVIEFPPTFIKRPMYSTVRASINSNATIICNPEGAPKPMVQWYQNNMPVGTGGRFRVLPNGNLIIMDVTKMDEANYTCDASNRLGRSAQSTYLFIVDATQIEPPLEPVIYANINQTFFLPCTAYKPPNIDITYLWKFNNEAILMDEISYAQDSYLRPGDLRIIRAQYTMEGEYRCLAKTTVDEVSISYHVYVRGPPGPAAGVKCGKMGETYGQVTFVSGTDHGDPVVNYTIEAATDRHPAWMPVKVNFSLPFNPSGEYVVNVYGLAAWSAYQFRVRASNSFGYGEASQASDSCNTNQDIPGAPPANVSGGGGKIGDLKITWSPLPVEHWNGEDLRYVVYFRKLGVTTAWEKREVPFEQNYYVEYIIDSAPYVPYEVQVSAKNIRGEGPLSNISIVYTAEGIPRKPVSNVKCEPYNSTAILVTWDPIPEDDFSILQGKLLGYVVRYWRHDLDENLNYWRKRFLGQRSSAIIIGLEPDTVYFVRVYVFNSAGEGVESELFSHRTFRRAPMTYPTYVKVYQPDKPKDRKVILPDNREMYKLNVEWRGVSTDNNEEPLEGYYIKVWEYYQSIRNATIFYAPADVAKWQIDNIFKNRNYRLRVQGWSLGGEGKLSSPLKEFRIDNDGRLLILYNPDSSLLYYGNNSVNSKLFNSKLIYFILTFLLFFLFV